jgi:hypothetical protein
LRELVAEAVEARTQLRDDVIKITDDLRQRVHDRAALAATEMREVLERKFVSQLAEVEKRADDAEARARAAETVASELRGQIRDEAVRLADDLRQRAHDVTAAARYPLAPGTSRR